MEITPCMAFATQRKPALVPVQGKRRNERAPSAPGVARGHTGKKKGMDEQPSALGVAPDPQPPVYLSPARALAHPGGATHRGLASPPHQQPSPPPTPPPLGARPPPPGGDKRPRARQGSGDRVSSASPC